MHKIVSLIPARGNSKGVPKKNIKELAGQPLIGYSILDSILCKRIDETYVTTDNPEIAQISFRFGANVPFLRPKELVKDGSKDIDYVKHFLSWFERKYDGLPEYIVLLRPTTPIRNEKLINNAIKKIKKNKDCSSLRSVEEFVESPYKWYDLDKGYLKPLLSDDFEAGNSPRQDSPIVYRPNGYVDIIRVNSLIENNSLYGEKILAFKTPKTIEIDTIEEFNYAEMILSH